ncbi:energy-coupling factor ABC transporter permease [Accumulibacter sp.]|uniref:energy-coupling factor ABC transporter permease n=1 Tax=Accumulibacter sp. TaxID=2053492 RepID=UPI0025DFDB5E|nr:energy-coupling factor ABC transporter permease [Accumulibacter sp.]MCM8594897.1 energy-coupling factor ABC transporter permease [Accumulibacter sp.]MCM8627839.1 energy-coupling factor ABC transporter permease [Accumulibacter sp.]MDS4049043.1 energy-coupling factor ABC transporter permease [Accumulibacter sp.]
MNLPDGLVDGSWTLLGWLVYAVLAFTAVRRAPWAVLADGARLNAFLAMIVVLSIFWQLRAGVKPGLSLHLLGATLFTLCFGWQLAFIGLSLVVVGVTLNGAAGGETFALNALLMAGVGVAASHSVHQLIDRLFPRHLFIYIFCKGFFASALAVVAVGGAACLVLALAGAYPGEYLTSEYLPYFLLLGFSEAWLSGMLVTLLAVYRPHLLTGFEDAQLLGKK